MQGAFADKDETAPENRITNWQKPNIMKKILFTLIIFLSILQLRGQTDIFNWKLSAGAATFRFENAFSFPGDFKSAAANLQLERSLNRSFSAGISLFAGQPAGGDLKKAGYAALTLGFRWDNGWLLGERVFLAPFHTIEAGYLAGETRNGASDVHEFAVGMTHGLKFRLSDRISARVATALYYPINDSQGSKLSELNFYQQWQLGLSYHFGARKISYRGPVFNAGDFFPILPGTQATQPLSFDEAESTSQPVIRPRVIEEEKVIERKQVARSEENRIDISLTDSLIQIRVSEGEAVTINIAHQMFGTQRTIETKKTMVIEAKEAEEAPEGKIDEKSETAVSEIPAVPAEKEKTEVIEKEVEVVSQEIVTETMEGEIAEKVIIIQKVPEENKELEETEEAQPIIQPADPVKEEVVSEIKIERPVETIIERQEKKPAMETPLPISEKEPETEAAPKETVVTVVAVTEIPELTPDSIDIQVPDSIMARYPVVLTFPSNSASLLKWHQESLEQVAADLEAYPGLLCRISGYTDKSGDPIYNMILSGRRAEAVLHFLMDCGIDPGRLSAEAQGDQFSSEEFNEADRRVEIHLLSAPEPEEEP